VDGGPAVQMQGLGLESCDRVQRHLWPATILFLRFACFLQNSLCHRAQERGVSLHKMSLSTQRPRYNRGSIVSPPHLLLRSAGHIQARVLPPLQQLRASRGLRRARTACCDEGGRRPCAREPQLVLARAPSSPAGPGEGGQQPAWQAKV
jgi:hypothetical protein